MPRNDWRRYYRDTRPDKLKYRPAGSWWHTYGTGVNHRLTAFTPRDLILFGYRRTACGELANLDDGCQGDISGVPNCGRCTRIPVPA